VVIVLVISLLFGLGKNLAQQQLDDSDLVLTLSVGRMTDKTLEVAVNGKAFRRASLPQARD